MKMDTAEIIIPVLVIEKNEDLFNINYFKFKDELQKNHEDLMYITNIALSDITNIKTLTDKHIYFNGNDDEIVIARYHKLRTDRSKMLNDMNIHVALKSIKSANKITIGAELTLKDGRCFYINDTTTNLYNLIGKAIFNKQVSQK